jgi:fibronectin type 3 domain-containing protein
MKKNTLFLYLLMLVFGISTIHAQTTTQIVAQPVTDRTVTFSVSDTGVYKPITWGLDLAWLSESNIRRGITFMGADRVDVVRASFQPTLPLVNGDIQGTQITDLNTRLGLIDLTGTKTKVVLNCDPPTVDASYLGNAVNWAALIDATVKRVQARGRTVVSVSPFNEPDYGWGQYSGSNGQRDFFNICAELRKNTRFDSIRICGANTLNCDQALPWYNALKTYLDEGNTHQLAGSFDNYAAFFQAVRANGDLATGDELHNVMDAMVGVEYGMQTGIWWGTAEYARGEFVKASDGRRLGYAEHRPNWTAASVYRSLEGKVQAFGGTSERQAATTTYKFVSKDKDVFFDGNGPQREYIMTLPGGTAYQTGQTNAERVVNITWGDDVQPVINGRYVLVNRNSGKVVEVTGGSSTAGATLRQNALSAGATYQQWNVTPVDSRVGGDFSYYTMTAVNSSKSMDLLNWSLTNGGGIIIWDDVKGANQQWYLEYASDGWFYIRNRHSGKCMDVAGSSIANTAMINHWDYLGRTSQQWRFIPVGAPVEFVAPSAPSNLVATPSAASVRLDWTASPETDVAGYTIYRSDSTGKKYNILARNVTTTSFVDNTTMAGKPYYYVIRAVDNSLNRSIYSNEVNVTLTNNHEQVARLQFDGNTLDSTVNLNHSASYGGITYSTGKVGSNALTLNGSTAFLQLPTNVANLNELTIATWVYWNGITTGQRIFDFGSSSNEYMYLSPRVTLGGMRFGIKNNGTEQQLNTTVMPTNKWSHVAVTMNATGVSLYVNGVLATTSSSITIRPTDFKPCLNYIGRSQSTYPLFYGMIDDFRIYNYALSANEVADLAGTLSGMTETKATEHLSICPVPAKDKVQVSYLNGTNLERSTLRVFNIKGQQVLQKEFVQTSELDVSSLPSDIYLLKLTNQQETIVQKLTVKH